MRYFLFGLAVVLCTIAGTWLLGLNRHLGCYEIAASVYPMQMRSDCQTATVNPCFEVRRILASEDLKAAVLEHFPSKELDKKNYSRRVRYHETNDHQMVIQVFMRDSSAALAVAAFMVDYVNNALLQSPQRQHEDCGLHEAAVSDYALMAGNCSATVIYSVVTDSPRIMRSPSIGRWGLYGSLSFLFSLLVLGTTVYLWRRF